jgi:hypothetical protein
MPIEYIVSFRDREELKEIIQNALLDALNKEEQNRVSFFDGI